MEWLVELAKWMLGALGLGAGGGTAWKLAEWYLRYRQQNQDLSQKNQSYQDQRLKELLDLEMKQTSVFADRLGQVEKTMTGYITENIRLTGTVAERDREIAALRFRLGEAVPKS